jgi:ectoine hydroxylase-related dioxygenase (phytanoyl-CoA dioxygenase family)
MGLLSAEQLAQYDQDGILVVPNVLSEEEIAAAIKGFDEHLLLKDKVDVTKLSETHTNKAGLGGRSGLYELYLQPWKMKVHESEKAYQAITDLYSNFFAKNIAGYENPFAEHMDGSKAFLYIDRVNFRLPSSIKAGEGLIQHVDCDPCNLYGFYLQDQKELDRVEKEMLQERAKDKTGLSDWRVWREGTQQRGKWRPIQGFIALTDNLEANRGGFEAAPGWHKKVESKFTKSENPKGEFTALHEHKDIVDDFKHIPYAKGSLVLWDWRTPHRNADRHEGDEPRRVVYQNYLPDVPVNRLYVKYQLHRFHKRAIPPDFSPPIATEELIGTETYTPNDTGKQLLGMLLLDAPQPDANCCLL